MGIIPRSTILARHNRGRNSSIRSEMGETDITGHYPDDANEADMTLSLLPRRIIIVR
jgi:hypothetical protein